MSFVNALFRGMGIGLSLAVATWMLGLSVMFISQDAHHQVAHLGAGPASIYWPGLFIGLSVIEFVGSTLISLMVASPYRGDS